MNPVGIEFSPSLSPSCYRYSLLHIFNEQAVIDRNEAGKGSMTAPLSNDWRKRAIAAVKSGQKKSRVARQF